jgi:hypothetical protein
MLSTLGLQIVKNIRSVRHVRVAPNVWATETAAERSQPITSSKDRQLVLMLLIDIVIYIAFSAVMVIIIMRQQITQYQTKDLVQIQFEIFLRNVATFSVNIPFCVGLYTNLFVSKTFRSEVKRVFWCR